MAAKKTKQSARELYHEGTDHQSATDELNLGPWTSFSLKSDPKHMVFVLSRYKFCAKMLQGKKTIMEVGSGDGFGLPIIAQGAEHVHTVDWDENLLQGNARRLKHLKNVSYHHLDINTTSPKLSVDGALLVDVLEHIEPSREAAFMENIVGCIKADGVMVNGTPNITASAYASPQSAVQHINLKSMQTLRTLMEKYFTNVFMFGMNDEVLHTGYGAMCHYLWAVGAGVRPEWRKK